MPVLGISIAVIVFALSVGAHFALFRFVISHHAFAARHRRAVGVAVFALAALPTLRALAGLWSPLRLVAQVGALWHLVLITAVALALAFHGARRLARAGTKTPSLPSDPARRDLVVGATALAASAGVYGWGAAIGRRSFEVTELAVKMPRLARTLDGFTIVQLSDLHVGPLMDERELARAIAAANALRPDLVVLTGDIIDSERRWIEAGARALSRLEARFGVLAIPVLRAAAIAG